MAAGLAMLAARAGAEETAAIGEAARFRWAGAYLGVNAGYGKAESVLERTGANNVYTFNAANYDAAAGDRPSLGDSGFLGGLQAGYSVQLNRLVLGLELDVERIGASKARGETYASYAADPFLTTDSFGVSALFTARGRVGVVMGPALLFASAGLAVTHWRHEHQFTDSLPPLYNETSSASGTRTGWAAGGGVEWALDERWSLRGEYLYAGFGHLVGHGVLINTMTGQPAVAVPSTGATTFGHAADLSIQMLRVALSYRL